MPIGWVELTKRVNNPNWKQGDRWYDRYIEVPTGEHQCPDCYYTVDALDPNGIHTCPELTDGHGTNFTIGSKVYVFAKGRIRKGEATRWKKETGMLTVLSEDKDGNEQRHVINHFGKVLVIDEQE